MSKEQLDKILGLIQTGKKEGATLETGGTRWGDRGCVRRGGGGGRAGVSGALGWPYCQNRMLGSSCPWFRFGKCFHRLFAIVSVAFVVFALSWFMLCILSSFFVHSVPNLVVAQRAALYRNTFTVLSHCILSGPLPV